MSFFDWISSLFKTNTSFTGVIPDPRTASEIALDYTHTERVSTTTTDPFGNAQITQSPYPYENQLSTSECVPHATTLALAIERKTDVNNFVLLSPSFPYRLRFNYPQEGSAPENIYNILKNTGAPLLTTLPTPQTEGEANAVTLTQEMYDEAAIYKGNLYWSISPANDITSIASVAQEGHAVTILLFATLDEYALQYPYVANTNLTIQQAEVQHEVCVIPYSGFIKDGVKYVTIQDSAWFGGQKIRYLSENFIKTRVVDARYWTTVQTLGGGAKPAVNFVQTLIQGSTGQPVLDLQHFLIWQQLLPSDCATGTFGNITLSAVKAFQAKYASDILLPNGLIAPTGIWGIASQKKANQLLSG